MSVVNRRRAFAPAFVALAILTAGVSSAPTTRTFKGTRAWSEYVTMSDGVRIAVDVHLPEGLAAGERTATILQMSRYYRSIDVRGVARLFMGSGVVPVTELDLREPMVKAGYSWVDVDVRGAGASFGHHDYPLSPEEVRDGSEIIDWIVKQPWASGEIGATGSSYNGAMALMLLGNRQPALKAVVSRFAPWDVYEDLWLPGGVQSHQYLDAWSRLVESFDRGRLPDVFGWSSGLAVRGPRPVDASVLPQAIADHASNVNVFRLLNHVVNKNDPLTPPRPVTIENFSPHTTTPRGVPVYFYGGWYDGALVAGQVRGYNLMAGPGTRLRMGPWFHGGEFNGSPFAKRGQRPFDHAAEVIRFFDRHLRSIDNGIDKEPPVQYYAMGAEEWRGSITWPPPETSWRSWYLGAAGSMTTTAPPAGEAEDVYRVDAALATPRGSRWGLVLGTTTSRGYGDRRNLASRMLTYSTPALSQSVEVTGAPRLHLQMSSDAGDGAVFAYLEDVSPTGRVTYVTEGQLRLLHRSARVEPNSRVLLRSFHRADAQPMLPGQVSEVMFDLQPVSYRFSRGHRIRLAISGHDAANFSQAYSAPSPTYRFHRDGLHPSRIELPIFSQPD